jgi:hypothetical protein
MEYLVGLDYCSFRLPCKMILGDRSYFTTKKRYEGKVKMLDVYKKSLDLKQSKNSTKSTGKKNIFDIEQKQRSLGLEGAVSQLQAAIDQVQSDKGSSESDELLSQV